MGAFFIRMILKVFGKNRRSSVRKMSWGMFTIIVDILSLGGDLDIKYGEEERGEKLNPFSVR